VKYFAARWIFSGIGKVSYFMPLLCNDVFVCKTSGHENKERILKVCPLCLLLSGIFFRIIK
jgi:hypothetical protein